MAKESQVKAKRLSMYPQTAQIKPIANCRRCGISEHSLNKGTRTISGRLPDWFYGRNNKVGSLPALQTPDAQRVVREMADSELSRLQKVQEWLRRSYKYPHAVSRTLPEERADKQPKSLLIQTPSPGTVNGYDVKRRYLPATMRTVNEPFYFPDFVSSQMSYLEFRRKKKGCFGLRPEFTDYLTPNKSFKLRLEVGSIQRPHTPLQPLGKRQRELYGQETLYGYLDNNRQTAGQKLDNQKQKIDTLQSQLEDMIRR